MGTVRVPRCPAAAPSGATEDRRGGRRALARLIVALVPAVIALASLALLAAPSADAQSCEAISTERLGLLDERVGYGRNATGGAAGCLYRVTNLNDSGSGSLRAGAQQANRWVVFDVSGTIRLSTPIDVASNTTIDGRGADVTVSGRGLYLVDRTNVIITNITLADIAGSNQDAIQIRRMGSKDVWVDHVTVRNVQGGYIDITMGATNVTVSWSRFERSPAYSSETPITVGVGAAGDRDELTYVTLHHNYFDRTRQGNPLIRRAYVHAFNNYVKDWTIYGGGVAKGGRLYSQANVYEYSGFHRGRAFTPWESGGANIRSASDLFLFGSSGVTSTPGNVGNPSYAYRTDGTADLPAVLEADAGARSLGAFGDARPVAGATPTPTAPAAACTPIPEDRVSLLDARLGFGAGATGGAEGCLYRVTNLRDSGAGSLRDAASRPNRWIIFDVSGEIPLRTSIDVSPNTTIDGRGADVTISGRGLYMVNRANVILTHLTIEDVFGAGEDAIQVRRTGSRDIWINHVTIRNVEDGHIDVTMGATNVTVSWSRFERSPTFLREKTMVIGAGDPGDQDQLTYVTLHHNFFDSTQQRNPLIHGAYVHAFNNYIRNWQTYGVGVSVGGRYFSEGNVYESGGFHQHRAFTPWETGNVSIRSSGDRFLLGASGIQSRPSQVPGPDYSYRLDATSALPAMVASRAGSRATDISACEGISSQRRALLDEREGFGRAVTGGAGGCVYHVTNRNNSGPGSLREGASQANTWVVFDVSGTIWLNSPIDVAPDTTIDGRGAQVTIANHGLYLVNRANVIITHLRIAGIDGRSEDAIQLRKAGTTDVWVNHVTIEDVEGGYIDITEGATNVTVSWSRFGPSPDGVETPMTIGLGASADAATAVTLHHNVFDDARQQSPLVNRAYVHSYNNYIREWTIYGSGVGNGGRLLSERNVYEYGGFHRARAFTPWGSGTASIRSVSDRFLLGASGVQVNSGQVGNPPYSYRAESTSDLPARLQAGAGFQVVTGIE